MKKQNNFIILFLIIISSCKPINYIDEDYHSKYFPIELNQEKEFLVTNINHRLYYFRITYEWDGISNLIVEICYDNTAGKLILWNIGETTKIILKVLYILLLLLVVQ